ncbi:bilirubin utilization transcriptional regulator BilQ [Anaerorhabdus sp.]|uniref:bilirubin utilization transcriptional regulator BilQ n=1 Tax=Anaerorhabdus sp. TaxID=1872524 RepID=UPI002FCAD7BE
MEKTLAYYVTLLRKDFKEYCGLRLQDLGLSQGLFFFILYIGKHPNCSPSTLSESLKMDAGHTTRTLTKLEKTGFIIQEVNPNDRRAHTLVLTEKGQEAFQAGHDLFIQWDEVIFDNYPEQEKRNLLESLERLTKTKIKRTLQDYAEMDKQD